MVVAVVVAAAAAGLPGPVEVLQVGQVELGQVAVEAVQLGPEVLLEGRLQVGLLASLPSSLGASPSVQLQAVP